MATVASPRASIDELLRAPDKAELIGGSLVPITASGHQPSRVAFKIARHLDDYTESVRIGVTYADGMGFVEAPPPLAVEVRFEVG